MGKEIVFVNEFVVRGIVRGVEKNEHSGRTLRLLVKERRTQLELRITLNRGIGYNIGKKDRVVVRGYTKAFTYHNDVLKKDSYVMFFVATEVKKDQTELSLRFGKGLGQFYPEGVFRAFVSGRVESIEEPNEKNWAKLTIETCSGGEDLRPSHIVLRYYNGSRLPFFDYKIGDIICARLAAFTPERQIGDGKPFFFQNLIVEDIDFLEKMPRDKEKELRTAIDIGLPEITEEEFAAKEAEAVAEETFADDSELMEHTL